MKTNESSVLIFPQIFSLTARWVLLGALVILLISMGVGKNGFANYLELGRMHKIIINEVYRLQMENYGLRDDLHLLQTSEFHKIQYLKEDLGLVEVNEQVLFFNTNNSFYKTTVAMNNN